MPFVCFWYALAIAWLGCDVHLLCWTFGIIPRFERAVGRSVISAPVCALLFQLRLRQLHPRPPRLHHRAAAGLMARRAPRSPSSFVRTKVVKPANEHGHCPVPHTGLPTFQLSGPLHVPLHVPSTRYQPAAAAAASPAAAAAAAAAAVSYSNNSCVCPSFILSSFWKLAAKP